jgi:hypothetical protein
MTTPNPVVLILPVAVTQPDASGNVGWQKTRPMPSYPATPCPHWPLRQEIPAQARQERMEQARRVLAERRAERPVHY